MITRRLTDRCCMYLVAGVRQASLASSQSHNCAFKLTVWSEHGQGRFQVPLDLGLQVIMSRPSIISKLLLLVTPSYYKQAFHVQGGDEWAGGGGRSGQTYRQLQPFFIPDATGKRAFSSLALCIKFQRRSLIDWLGSQAGTLGKSLWLGGLGHFDWLGLGHMSITETRDQVLTEPPKPYELREQQIPKRKGWK